MTTHYSFEPDVRALLAKTQRGEVPSFVAQKCGADARAVRKLLDQLAARGDVVTCDLPLKKFPDDRSFRVAAADIPGTPYISVQPSRRYIEQANELGSIGPKGAARQPAVAKIAPAPVVTVTPSRDARTPVARASASTFKSRRAVKETDGRTARSAITRARLVDCLAASETALTGQALAERLQMCRATVCKVLRALINGGEAEAFGRAMKTRYAITGSRAAEWAERQAEGAAVASQKPAKISKAYDIGSRILEALVAAGTPLSRTLLAEKIGVHPGYISKALIPLIQDGQVIRLGVRSWCRFGLPGMTLAAPVGIEKRADDTPRPSRAATSAGVAMFPVLSMARESVIDVTPERDESVIQHQFRTGQFPVAGARDDRYRKTDQQIEIERVLTLLRQKMTDEEYRGYLRGTVMTLALAGSPEDLQRQQYFGAALAQVSP